MQRLLQTRPLPGPVPEAAVNLLLAAAWLNERLDAALEPVGISRAQYNVLRILKGVSPEGHPRCEIARRMIDRAPDVTRLIDRLERRRLVERGRDPQDARRSETRITRSGMALLTKASAAAQAVEQELARRLEASDVAALSEACESIYGPDEA